MTSVTYPTLTGTIVGSQLDTNFSDVVNLASSVGNEQLAGGITADKISDRYTLAYDTINIIPSCYSTERLEYIGNTGGGTNFLFNGGTGTSDVLQWQPILKPGVDAYLCSITAQIRTVTNTPMVRCYLNGTYATGALIGGAGIAISTAQTIYTLAQTDPIANPLIALSNGDYISVNLYANGAASGGKGLFVTFCVKYVLQS